MTKPLANQKRNLGSRQKNDAVGMSSKEKKTSGASIVRKGQEISLRKTYLIICEGETEAAYFEGLCDISSLREKFEIEILPLESQRKNSTVSDTSIKGLLYMAMKKQKNASIPYDEVWIVTDNDERNAYKLDNNSLEQIKKVVPSTILSILQSNQTVSMNVREDEKDKERIRYFLSSIEYDTFLRSILPTNDYTDYANLIVDNTTKYNDFIQLYRGNQKGFFYDNTGVFVASNNRGEVKFTEKMFDEHWKSYIKVAYTCISFEYWLLLHFEQCQLPFYNSRCIIKYFDDKNYFGGKFIKGWDLYDKRTDESVKAFFLLQHQAFLNNVWLNTQQQLEITSGKMLYEVNPYSNVFELTNSLFQIQTTIAYPNIPLDFRNLNELCAVQVGGTISVSFSFNRKRTTLQSELACLFSVTDALNNPINANIPLNKTLIYRGDFVKIDITLPNDDNKSPIFLLMKEEDKEIVYTCIWVFVRNTPNT